MVPAVKLVPDVGRWRSAVRASSHPAVMKTTKPIASLSLDLDDQWSYMKTHGDAGWQSFPSYLDLVVPRILDLLKAKGLTITVFIVGQDAALENNRETLRSISDAGHEIGNHSFHHEPWLHLYSERQIETEVAAAEDHIERATGQKPVGFRGPGFSLSLSTLRTLARRGYLYDASTFPTFTGPLARFLYLRTATLNGEELRQRRRLFGTFRDGWQPIAPYRWRLDVGGLIEMPVTTMPVLRLPIHVSYLLYLSGISRALALWYLSSSLTLCRFTGTHPSLILHPLDILGSDDTRDLSFFPAMSLSRGQKTELVSDVLDLLSARFTVLTLQEHAMNAAFMSNLPIREPRFHR